MKPLDNRAYKFMKNSLQLYIPAALTLYITLSQVWSWDFVSTENVVLTVTAIATFLGVILRISTNQYYNNASAPRRGQIVVTQPEPGRRVLSLELDDDPTSIKEGDAIMFKVVDKGEPTEFAPPELPPPVA